MGTGATGAALTAPPALDAGAPALAVEEPAAWCRSAQPEHPERPTPQTSSAAWSGRIGVARDPKEASGEGGHAITVA
jgi:hypothetical protein